MDRLTERANSLKRPMRKEVTMFAVRYGVKNRENLVAGCQEHQGVTDGEIDRGSIDSELSTTRASNNCKMKKIQYKVLTGINRH